ncbi:MAG: HoxN/HupN/NixA family nickel/cobalt transporter, partial [Chloroflexota bacterium]
GIVLLLHLAGLGLLVWQSPRFPALLGLGALAYSFGLRHAFDADHIAAIDNTTRKLLRDGQKPVAAGFFFSLGHSTVVFLIAIALGLVAKAVVNSVISEHGQLKSLGGLVGTSVSGAFLVIIGLLNLVILLDIVSTYRHLRRGEYDGAALEQRLVSGGVLTRVFSGLFRFITESWHLYPLGFLFGLGFDTASEVALLAISAGAASQGLPFLPIVSLPLIFAAGMTLMDTTDGAFMSKAYLWAFAQPTRKLFYNLTMTGLSVFIALFVGLVELLQMVARIANLHSAFWDWASNFDLSTLGFIIVAAFLVAWLIAFSVFKTRHVEERWAAMVNTTGASRE